MQWHDHFLNIRQKNSYYYLQKRPFVKEILKYGSLRKKCPYSEFSDPYFPTFRLNTEYLSVFSPNAGKCGPEKPRIRTLFTLWVWLWFFTNFFYFDFLSHAIPVKRTLVHIKKLRAYLWWTKTYLELCQTYMMEKVIWWKYLMTKSSIIDVWQSSTYISDGGLQL